VPVVQSIDYLAIAPPLIVALTALAVLAADAFVAVARRWLLDAMALGGVLAGFAATVALAFDGGRRTFCVPPGLAGGGPVSCSYVVDGFSLLLQMVVLAAAVVVLLMAATEIRATALPVGEFYFLVLASLAGALTLVASRDLVTLVVALEVVSLPVFALAALRRYDGRSSEAGLKMFLISVVSTAVMLFGISLVYGVSGAMHLDRIAAALAGPGPAVPVAAVGIGLVLVGFGFKVSAVPFHFWAPDTYFGAPLAVAAFLSVVSKAAGVAGFVLVLVIGFRPYTPVWGPIVAVLAAVTMTVGNLVALRQRYAVRLLAWSSIAQAGYILAPLGSMAGAVDGDVVAEVTGAAIDYLAIYVVMNIGAFAVVAVMARHRQGGELAGYRGFAHTNPICAVMLAFFLVCLAGLPPGLAGLFAKIVVFRAAITGAAGWLAVLIAINTVIGLYYYLAWASRMFAAPAEPAARAAPVPRTIAVAIATAAAATIALSVTPELLLHLSPITIAGLR
jgi:NADH-quinone oxidoreductase subunit N